jgi:mono/diheme cytochrome c family protein
MKPFTGKISFLPALFFLVVATAAFAIGAGQDKDDKNPPASPAANHNTQDNDMRLEGEKRFHSNCSRCHASPPKFPSRMMATIMRHMRVRATITDEDTRLILHYMTQ